MLGMHGTYQANLAMHGCDVMICIGARFDDRITGRLDAFSPGSKKIHVDIDRSSINKNVHVDVPIVGDCAHVLDEMIRLWRTNTVQPDTKALGEWWSMINIWRGRKSLSYQHSIDIIKPQYAIQRLCELTKDRDTYITTGVGQHQMWAAQHYDFNEPNRFMTSGGLGTMGYGLPAAIGVQVAHPDALVIDIDGDGSFEMTLQQLAVAVQYRLPVKALILNNKHDGMVRQWQDRIHGGRRFESDNSNQPDYVALAKAYRCTGILCEKPEELDECIRRMISTQGPVVFDCRVAREEDCLPMIMSGSPHNEMLLPGAEGSSKVSEGGKVMV
jgi:acetolactate synthase-1/2/3 large subunit